MTRVLLTNPYGPYELKWGTAPSDLLNARLGRGHGAFDMSSHLPTYPLYLIAENLKVPTTVLDFPRWDDFLHEIRKGYDFVAIELKSIHVRRVARMIGAIKEFSPKSQIVIGGYGVSALDDQMPGDKENLRDYILENADHLCRAEGVRFMRELVQDTPVDRPVTQYHMPLSHFNLPGMQSLQIRSPAILVSLGCPNACEFCNTSAFFHYKKQYIAEPAEVYSFMKSHQKRSGGSTHNFILFDEDMFLNQEYVRELGRLIRSDKKTWGFRWVTFGSIKALSTFEPEELRACGLQGVWLGVESSIEEDGKSKSGYAKRAGKSPADVINGMREWGIFTIASTILGFDFHDHENILEDIDRFVKLKPMFYQISPLTPCPGTRLFEKMQEMHRLHDDYDWNDFHLWKEAPYDHPQFKDGDIRRYYDHAHEKLRTENGPPLVQLYESTIMAYGNMHKLADPFFRYQAEQAVGLIRALGVYMKAIENNAPSPQVRERVRSLQAQADQLIGKGSLPEQAIRQIADAFVGFRIGHSAHAGPAGREFAPPTSWTYYDKPGQEPRVKEQRDAPAESLSKYVTRGSMGPLHIELPKLPKMALTNILRQLPSQA